MKLKCWLGRHDLIHLTTDPPDANPPSFCIRCGKTWFYDDCNRVWRLTHHKLWTDINDGT